MNNRLALMGALIATVSVVGPSVSAAQNPWRTDPQANGQYMTPPAPQPTPQPLPAPLPQPFQVPQTPGTAKYAPLDGNVDAEDHGYLGYPGGLNRLYAPGYGLGSVPGYGYGAPGFAGPGLGGSGTPLGYGGTPYLGGLGYPGYATPGLGIPGLGSGGYSPYNGLGNNFGGPSSWMPFW